MRNLLIMITTLNPGGAERIVWELSRRIRGYRVVVAALEGSGEYASRLRDEGITVYDLGCTRSWQLPGALIKLRRIIRSEHIHIINTHLFHAGIIGRLAAWLTGIPVIGTCHIAEKRKSSAWRFWVDRLLSKLARKEICVSEFVKKFQVEQTSIDPDYFLTIPNGIDLSVFTPSDNREQLRKETGLDPAAFTVGFLGRFDQQKGAEIFVNAMCDSSLQKLSLNKLIAGYGVLEEKLRFAAPDDLVFCGYSKEPQKFLQLLDVCIMPSRWEGFGLVAAEAMACGAVVLASDVDSLPEVLANGEAGVLIPSDDSGRRYAEELVALYHNPERLHNLRKSGLRNAQSYSIDLMVKQYEKLYNCF